MKLHFDANQQYQLDAIQSVIDIFEGQPLNTGDFSFSLNSENYAFQENGIGNRLQISETQILENVKKIQTKNDIAVTDKLGGLHFSIDMETGTGKTYVYLRTIYELYKNYGFKKFVIVVPSVAIREGVLKNLEITFEHFQNLYNKTPANFYVYDSSRVSNLRNFAVSNSIQILVINIDSFAKDVNIINKNNDKLTGKKPIEFIQAVNPIAIIDEPQNMETDIRKKAIENLNPLCTLRYSATHINRYNMIYSLDPVKAYDLGLVKQIEVDSVITENDFNEAYLLLEKTAASKTKTFAKIKIDINSKNGVERKSITANLGDDLFDLSNKRELYKHGYIINSIDVSENKIELSNGKTIFAGDSSGAVIDEVMKMQIRKTVEEHFTKEKKYKEKGIKILSLFFIDRVANYRSYDADGKPVKGKFAKWFEEIFTEFAAKKENEKLIDFPVESTHNGYFSADKKGVWKDTKGNTIADDDTFKLIMKNKEQLLDTNEPLRFIFSHSALREGWDNPNVFQICTLNETHSELKKRQEIGRGLRLPVNQDGVRIQDTNINRLTVIANEAYEDFAKKLQQEIEDECGVCFKDRIKNKRKRAAVKYRKGFELDPKFKDIWEKIKYKASYRVEYETQELIKKAAKAVNQMPTIKRAAIKTIKSELDFSKNGITAEIKSSSYSTAKQNVTEFPDILLYLQERTELTRKTIFEILQKSERLSDILLNPQLFLDYAVIAVKNVLTELMVDGIKYEKIGVKEYEMRLFEDYEIHLNDLTFKINKADKTIYSNLIPLDSGVEYSFAQECENRSDIEFYFKLPFWFKIKTPLGDYNPDWALIKKNEKTVYFVAETKSAGQELRQSEKQKIHCGKAHFKEFKDVKYRQVSSICELD